MNTKQRTLLNNAAKLVAAQSHEAPYTVRRGLDRMASDPELMSECVPVFGMEFDKLVQGMTDCGMLDVEFQMKQVF